jgi:hypothetical protein
LVDQLVGVEMGVPVEHLLEKEAFLLCVPQTSRLQKLLVSGQGRHRYRDGC